jgi:cell wall-associated NlpC family hydrolase
MGQKLANGIDHQRGDLLFWKGHVAMALDRARLIHATGLAMAVIEEDIADALFRIERQEGAAAFLGTRRLAPSPRFAATAVTSPGG